MARPSLSLRIIPRFPAKVQGADGVGVVRTGGAVTIKQDWSNIATAVGPFDQQAYEMLTRDPVTGLMVRAPLSAARAATTRIVTTAGDVTVLATDGIIGIDKTAPEATNVNLLPVASGNVLTVKDLAGNAGSYPITLVPDGSDTIDGAASFVLDIDGQSVTLQPTADGWALTDGFLGSGALPITRGGTGAATALQARSNLGLGAVAVLNPGTGLVADGSALDLADTAVTPGAYTYGNFTVNEQGRLTAASSGATLPVDRGGSGRTSATAYAVLCGGTTSTAAHQSIASVGTAGLPLVSNGPGALPSFQALPGVSGGYDIIIEDQKTSGTAGGNFASGADQIRTLNTLVLNRGAIAALASNQFTLPAGTYQIEWRAPGYNCTAHQTLLYNVTDAAAVARGSSSYTLNAAGVQTDSHGVVQVTIAGSKAFEIRHRCSVTNAAGLGQANSFGTEVYTQVRIKVVA